jgi:hypothetical protein
MQDTNLIPFWFQALRSGAWLTRDRVRGYAVVLLIMELTAVAIIVAGTHGWIVPLQHPTASDFVSFYAAGTLAGTGSAPLVYDRAAHFAAEQAATAQGIAYVHFYYPPVFLLVCAVFAKLPYLLSFLAFETAQLVPCLLLVRRILKHEALRMPAWLPLAFPAVFWAFGLGQNALLSAALLAGATLTLERRPWLAGALFGALCYKPHFGLLLPVALLAGWHWRAFLGAAASVATLVLASVLAFGWSTWQAFFTAAAGADSVYGHAGSIDVAGLTSPFGLTLALGGAPGLATGVQVVAIVGCAALVAWVWWPHRLPAIGPSRFDRPSLAVRLAVLLAAMPIAVPIVMFYDLMISGIALAWLVRDGWDRGFPPWQKSAFLLLFVLPLLLGNIGSSELMVPPGTAALVLILALRQAWYRPRVAVAAPALAQMGSAA